MNHVHGLNQICQADIHIDVGKSHERKFCVPVSVRSNHVAKMILHSSFDQDILAKYNHKKLFTVLFVTLFKLFCIHCHDSTDHIAVYISDQPVPEFVLYHKARRTFCAFILLPLTVFQLREETASQLFMITFLI